MRPVQQFPSLFQPGRIRKLEIGNRLIMAPMGTRLAEPDGRYSEREIDYYVARARGGVGMILTEATMVERKIGTPPDYITACLDSFLQLPRATELVDAVHDFGAKIGVQLSPGMGRLLVGASPKRVPVSASAEPAFTNPNVLCHELTVVEIKGLVQACGEAARLARAAGFDMIEIHAHGGYLIDQFMTPLWNKRTDEYGGTIQGRMRFAVDIIDAMRAAVGRDFPLCFRFAADHKTEGGRNLSEAREIARLLEEAGVDALHVDAGCYEAIDWFIPTVYMPEGCLVDLAGSIKEVVNIPVITVGNIASPELAEEVLAQGKADFICMGRALLADPDWPNKVRDGRVQEIRPCIRCHERCSGRVSALKSVSCSVNPTVGRERYYAITRADRAKKVMVVGGGPAGMEAARVAALRGHDVTLYEKEDELGGQLRAASQPAFKSSLGTLAAYLACQLSDLGVRVEIGQDVTPEVVDLVRPEAVVLATGATPLIPMIPGIDGPREVTVVDLFLSRKKAGDEVIVAGGGVAGCEAALSLAQEGRKVTIVEMLPEVAYDLNSNSRISLLRQLAQYGVTILTSLTIKEFTAEGLVATDCDGKQRALRADTVILAFGAKSENKLAAKLEGRVRELCVVGDCVRPRKIGEAIHEGFIAGWRI